MKPKSDSSSLETYDIKDPTHLNATQKFTFPPPVTPGPGPYPPQDQSYPHEVLPDPRGEFILVPDLGEDIVRIFAIRKTLDACSNPATKPNGKTDLVALPPLKLPPGTGPRHGGFAIVGKTKDVYFYVTGQISNILHAFRVNYTKPGEIYFQVIGQTDIRKRLDGSSIDVAPGTSGLHDSEVQISVCVV